jgi:L-glutamine-phosphate cytidylyltransferase
MKAIILAAGRGSRMMKMTEDRPKCLIELKGRTLLDWQLGAISTVGITEIGIVTGYRRDLIAARGSAEFHNPAWAKTNMVASLERAAAWLESDVCLVSYSDIFYEPQALRLLSATPADIAITYDVRWLESWQRRFEDPLSDAESFRLAQDGSVLEIGNKAERIEDIQGQYMGLLRIEPNGWREIQRVLGQLSHADRARIHMTGLLQKVATAGVCKVMAVAYAGEWGEIDSASDLAAYAEWPNVAGRTPSG